MPKEIEVPLATTTIAGLKFRGQEAKDELNQIEAGTLLILEPEPTNKYDPNAIRIISPKRGDPGFPVEGGVFLGYIPKSMNQTVLSYLLGEPHTRIECRLMEKGQDLVNIIGFEQKAETDSHEAEDFEFDQQGPPTIDP